MCFVEVVRGRSGIKLDSMSQSYPKKTRVTPQKRAPCDHHRYGALGLFSMPSPRHKDNGQRTNVIASTVGGP